jgi:hypothetical protein
MANTAAWIWLHLGGLRKFGPEDRKSSRRKSKAFHRRRRRPVGVPGFSGFYSEELARAIKEHGEKIQRGAMWNKRAAIVTGLSAAAQCLSFGLPLIARLWR